MKVFVYLLSLKGHVQGFQAKEAGTVKYTGLEMLVMWRMVKLLSEPMSGLAPMVSLYHKGNGKYCIDHVRKPGEER